MIIIVILFIFGFFQNSLTVPRNCTKEDLCRPVPANTCDDSLCQPFDIKDWVALSSAGLTAYTWTVGQKPFIGPCPFKFHFEASEGDNCQTIQTAILQQNSGPYCNITTTSPLTFIPDKPDPNTGKIKILKEPQAGDMYNACLLYFEPDVAFVYRTCRVDPPPPYGQGCASVYAYVLASDNCNKTNLVNFIDSLGIEFKKETVDCL